MTEESQPEKNVLKEILAKFQRAGLFTQNAVPSISISTVRINFTSLFLM
jgi:hypothetical protein